MQASSMEPVRLSIMLSWEKCDLRRKTNLRLSFTREERVNIGCGSEAEKHRASATKVEAKAAS